MAGSFVLENNFTYTDTYGAYNGMFTRRVVSCYGRSYVGLSRVLVEYDPDADTWTEYSTPGTDYGVNWVGEIGGVLYVGLIDRNPWWTWPGRAYLYQFGPDGTWTLIYTWADAGAPPVDRRMWAMRGITFGTNIYIATWYADQAVDNKIWQFNGTNMTIVKDGIPNAGAVQIGWVPYHIAVWDNRVWTGWWKQNDAVNNHRLIHSADGAAWTEEDITDGVDYLIPYAIEGHRAHLYVAGTTNAGPRSLWRRDGFENFTEEVALPAATFTSMYSALDLLWIGNAFSARAYYYDHITDALNHKSLPADTNSITYGLVQLDGPNNDHKLVAFTTTSPGAPRYRAYRLDNAEDWSLCAMGTRGKGKSLDVSKEDGSRVHIAMMTSGSAPLALMVPAELNSIEKLYPSLAAASSGSVFGIVSEYQNHDEILFFGKIDGAPIQRTQNTYEFGSSGSNFIAQTCRNVLVAANASGSPLALTSGAEVWESTVFNRWHKQGNLSFDPLGADRYPGHFLCMGRYGTSGSPTVEMSWDFGVSREQRDTYLPSGAFVSDMEILK